MKIAPRRQARKGATLFIAAVAAMGTLSACGSDPEPSPSEMEAASNSISEITKRGLTEVVRDYDGPGKDTYYGTMGRCRIQVEHHQQNHTYTAIQGETHVPDFSVPLLQMMPEFAHCFKDEASSPTQPAPVK